MRVHPKLDEAGLPIDGSDFSAPVVLVDKCVGCGLCQTRCHSINVKTKHLLGSSAIVVEAGPGKEDRMSSGSYLALREQVQNVPAPGAADSYLPSFLKEGPR